MKYSLIIIKIKKPHFNFRLYFFNPSWTFNKINFIFLFRTAEKEKKKKSIGLVWFGARKLKDLGSSSCQLIEPLQIVGLVWFGAREVVVRGPQTQGSLFAFTFFFIFHLYPPDLFTKKKGRSYYYFPKLAQIWAGLGTNSWPVVRAVKRIDLRWDGLIHHKFDI